VQVGLLGLEDGDRLLRLLVLRLLSHVVPLHFFFGPDHIFRQLLSDVSRFTSKVLLKLLLLAAQCLDLSVVEVEFLGEGLAGLLEPVDLALQRRVERVRPSVRACLHCHLFSGEERRSKSALIRRHQSRSRV
jgi:hypothetical protein